MAAIVTELIKRVFDQLNSESLKPIFRSMEIHSKMKNVEKSLTHIQMLLADASEKELLNASVQLWLNRLQHVVYDIDDILDGLATEAMHYGVKEKTSRLRKFAPTCCSPDNQLSLKLHSIAIEFRDLERDAVFLGLVVRVESSINMRKRKVRESCLTDAPVIVGREAEKKILLDTLLEVDQDFRVVPIVGMGGVGKTTLARHLYNDIQVNAHFELKAWVYVSHDFDVFDITKAILEGFSRENQECRNLNQLQVDLRGKLRDKRFLLVLDDVWSERYDDWEILLSPFHLCAPGSKIIMTTRKEQLVRHLGFGHLHKLKSLSHDDALSLFAYRALGVYNFDSHPRLKQLGERSVQECGGLPLALVTLGGMLKTLQVEEWEHVLNREVWRLRKNDVLLELKRSYDDLPACLKQLFAFCSLFPRDFIYDIDGLVMLWMAEGFLNKSIANKPAEHLGHEYFEMLLSRSFFQLAPNEESLYVMHNLMNELAIFVAGDYFFLRFDNKMKIENVDLVRYRHMSFITKEFVAYPLYDTFKKAKSLRTFLSVSIGLKEQWEVSPSSNKILEELLHELPLLRVLSLSSLPISELP